MHPGNEPTGFAAGARGGEHAGGEGRTAIPEMRGDVVRRCAPELGEAGEDWFARGR